MVFHRCITYLTKSQLYLDFKIQKKTEEEKHVIILVLVLYTSTVQDLCAWKSENITRNSQKKICMPLNPTPRINKIASSFMLLHNSWQHCTYQSNRARVFSIYLRLQKYISSHFVFFCGCWIPKLTVGGYSGTRCLCSCSSLDTNSSKNLLGNHFFGINVDCFYFILMENVIIRIVNFKIIGEIIEKAVWFVAWMIGTSVNYTLRLKSKWEKKNMPRIVFITSMHTNFLKTCENTHWSNIC